MSCFGEYLEPEEERPVSGRFTAISGNCGIRADRSLVCWGSRASIHAPGPFTALAVTDNGVWALRADGTLAVLN